MSRQRFTFKTLPPEYSDLDRWRTVDITELPEYERERFTALKTGIETYVRTGKLKAASKGCGYSGGTIIKQLNRCVTVADDGQLWGWGGLLRGMRIKQYVRTAPFPAGPRGKGRGFSGCFSKFLQEHSDIKAKIDALILKKPRTRELNEARISVKQLTASFFNLCRENGVREDEYPLNVISRAKRSMGRYLARLIREHSGEGTEARYGEVASKHLSVGTGDSSMPLALAPYDVGCLDAHKIDCIGCVIVPGPAGNQQVAIERLWVIFVAENFSKAILGYCVGIRTEVSSATVEQALQCAISRWQPRQLTIPGLRYREGSGLPSGVIPQLAGCFPAILSFDNAAVHFAKRIAERARKRLGCALTWGGVGHWEHNAIVERLFKTLETYGFQRLPSTTGSNPIDPIKDNPVEKATKIGITWDALLDLLDVLVANYNVTENRGLGGQSPLQVLRNNLELCEPTFLPRHLPPPTVGQPELGVVVETRFVRGSQKFGRRPYIEIDRVRYTSPTLAHSFGLVSTQIRVHICEADMRTVDTFFVSGQQMGTLRALGKWGRTPHTREMRKQIMALVDAGELPLGSDDDPVVKFLQYYASKTYRHALERPKSVSRDATKLANAVNISGLPVPPSMPRSSGNQIAEDESNPLRPIPSTIKATIWKSVT